MIRDLIFVEVQTTLSTNKLINNYNHDKFVLGSIKNGDTQ